jgi:hypothetical protein
MAIRFFSRNLFASGTYKRRGRLQIQVHWRRRRRLATNVRLETHQREVFRLLKGADRSGQEPENWFGLIPTNIEA